MDDETVRMDGGRGVEARSNHSASKNTRYLTKDEAWGLLGPRGASWSLLWPPGVVMPNPWETGANAKKNKNGSED